MVQLWISAGIIWLLVVVIPLAGVGMQAWLLVVFLLYIVVGIFMARTAIGLRRRSARSRPAVYGLAAFTVLSVLFLPMFAVPALFALGAALTVSLPAARAWLRAAPKG